LFRLWWPTAASAARHRNHCPGLSQTFPHYFATVSRGLNRMGRGGKNFTARLRHSYGAPRSKRERT
jgi:hypothetical protein